MKPSSSELKIPRHVAIILDGNGRWAQSRGLSRSEGHRAGAEALNHLLNTILELGIPAVSLYAFSTENWKRPKPEVLAIWSLVKEFFDKNIENCIQKGIRIRTSGHLPRIPGPTRLVMENAAKRTAKGKHLVANFCVNYGSQDEILNSFDQILEQRLQSAREGDWKTAQKPVTKKDLEKHLYTYPLPDVDLLIRPGGESRLSNFLLWQCAYAEIYITPTLWPDFTRKDLLVALEWFTNRDRRFGGLSEGKS